MVRKIQSFREAKEVDGLMDKDGTIRKGNFAAGGSELHMPKWRIDPTSHSKKSFDLLVIVLVVYNALATPIQVAFGGMSTAAWDLWEACVDVTFLIDLLLNFFTGRLITTHVSTHM